MPAALRGAPIFPVSQEKEFVDCGRALVASRRASSSATSLPKNALGAVDRSPSPSTRPANPSGRIDPVRSWASAFPPRYPDWGRVLSTQGLSHRAAWALFPGAALFFTVLFHPLHRRRLRDALDPLAVDLW